jgi:hypothetical protein
VTPSADVVIVGGVIAASFCANDGIAACTAPS